MRQWASKRLKSRWVVCTGDNEIIGCIGHMYRSWAHTAHIKTMNSKSVSHHYDIMWYDMNKPVHTCVMTFYLCLCLAHLFGCYGGGCGGGGGRDLCCCHLCLGLSAATHYLHRWTPHQSSCNMLLNDSGKIKSSVSKCNSCWCRHTLYDEEGCSCERKLGNILWLQQKPPRKDMGHNYIYCRSPAKTVTP